MTSSRLVPLFLLLAATCLLLETPTPLPAQVHTGNDFMMEPEQNSSPRRGLRIRQSYLHLNGYSIHFDKRPEPGESVNDYLIGLGYAAEFDTQGTLIYEFLIDVFNDSREEISAVFGPTVQYPLNDYFHIGAAGLLMYKKAFEEDYNFPLLPTPLPFAELRGERLSLRSYYIPPVRKPTDHQIVFQLRIAL